jgi:hypothetical protein
MERPLIENLFYYGLIVEDLAAAQQELTDALGLTWLGPKDFALGEWTIRAAMSEQGPPYWELILAQAGSPWDLRGGARLDHLGFWTDDVDQESQALERIGFELDADARVYGSPAVYHRGPASGVRIELLGTDARQPFYERWNLGPHAHRE